MSSGRILFLHNDGLFRPRNAGDGPHVWPKIGDRLCAEGIRGKYMNDRQDLITFLRRVFDYEDVVQHFCAIIWSRVEHPE